MWPLLVVAAISAGSAIYGAYEGKQASDKQAKADKLAAQNAMDQFYQTRTDLAPYRAVGVNALAKYSGMLATGPGDYRESPGYQVRLKQGLNAIRYGAAARGLLGSGGTDKALMRYGQDYATNDYGNFMADWYNRLNATGNLANTGLGAAETTGQFGANAVNNAGNYNVLSAEASGGGNAALAGAGYGIAQTGNALLDNYMLMQSLNKRPDVPVTNPQNNNFLDWKNVPENKKPYRINTLSYYSL